MLASQWIYTACGKDRTGAFSVWAKSADITKAESDEIQKTMEYKRLSHYPYEPTEEELNSIFHKKFGYFRLSTGRYCVAQCSFVGKVYSDTDMRNGNVFIHAFVMDDIGSLLPMTIIGSDKFKTKLTYEEWHENDAPEDLPKVDLTEFQNGLNKGEIDSFFDEDNGRKLELLLQAIINAANADERVTFHDTDDNLRYWYKAISLCLPKSMQSKMTFGTYYKPVLQMPNQTASPMGMQADVMIRNVHPEMQSSIFQYSQAVQGGKYAFDFQSNILNRNITVSRFVKSVVKMMRENLFNALMMVDTTDKLIKSGNYSIDEAASIANLQKGNYDWFEGIDDLLGTIEKAKQAVPEALPKIADRLYTECVVRGRWACCPNLLPVYRFVFDYAEMADKANIIEKYVENQNSFGISSANGCEEYARQMMAKAPFLWVNFVDYIFEPSKIQSYFAINGEGFDSRYLVYVTLVNALGDITESQKPFAHNYLVEMMALAIKDESNAQIQVLLSTIGKRGEKWANWIVKNAFAMLLKNGGKVTDVCSPDFLLGLIAQLPEEKLGMLILKQLVDEKGTDDYFVYEYVTKAETAKEKFERYETLLQAEPAYGAFVECVEIQRFSRKQNPSLGELNRYYKQYYSVGKDNGVFAGKMENFIRKTPKADIPDTCIEMYREWFADLPNEHLDVLDCLARMSEIIFDLDVKLLIQYSEKKGLSAFTPMLKRIYESKLPIPAKYYVVKLGFTTRAFWERRERTGGPSRKEIVDALERHDYYKNLRDQESVDQFVEHFMADVVKMCLDISRKQDLVSTMENCMEKLSESRKFNAALFAAVEDLEKNNYAWMITQLFSYALTQNTPLADRLKRGIDVYLDEAGRGKRKKIFSTVTEFALPVYQKDIKQFINKYQKEHESFFDKLFGGGGKADRDEEKPARVKKKFGDDDGFEDESEEESGETEPKQGKPEKRRWKK